VLLFAYGSNLAAGEIGPEARFLGPGRLADFKLALTRRSIRWGSGVSDIVAAPGQHVWGAVYELPSGALEAIDRKEGEGFAYRRRPVEVVVRGELCRAEAYEVIDKEVDVPSATPEYASLVLEGARDRGLPEAWIATLGSVLSGSVPGP
jgi:gamma-glutamylcyclotransferase (GGCT)/AIG2-like uncharacterized protein YtfP